jgi:hypothetical protein
MGRYLMQKLQQNTSNLSLFTDDASAMFKIQTDNQLDFLQKEFSNNGIYPPAKEFDYFDQDFKDVSKHPVMSSLLKET